MTKFYTYVYYTQEDASTPTYVGKGKSKRFKDHLKAKTHFGNHLRKQLAIGIFPITVKYAQPSEEAAFAEEKRLIALFGRSDLGAGTLYNKTDGGEGIAGFHHSKETRAKISTAHIGKKQAAATPEHRANLSRALSGKKRTPLSHEHREAISVGKTGRKRKSFSTAVLEKIAAKNRKPCTVDGIVIYPSRSALIAALGRTLKGSLSPTFRYV
jgi:hypothetical protein